MVNLSITQPLDRKPNTEEWEEIRRLQQDCTCNNPHTSALACSACIKANRIKYGDSIPFGGK